MTFVDTNVLSDILSKNPDWLSWSIAALASQSKLGPLVTNDVVYAELSMNISSIDQLDLYLDRMNVQVVRTPRAALFLAARTFHRYRT